MALITCEDLSLGYDGRAIVSKLNFSVRRGDYLCIVGENGSGKSTLMKTLLDLQKPLGGKILTGDGLHKNQIGYLPQQSAAQKDFPASVKEIVLSGLQNKMGLRPFYSRKEIERAKKNIARFGLSGMEERCYRELSGGQQQRVLLARALCASESLLLLDEPVSGLDPVATADLYALIEELNKQDGVTVIMISHDVRAALTYATHILHIADNIFFGTREEYLNSERGRDFTGGKNA